METTILCASSDAIQQATELLKNGNIIAFPTETVYGLGARIFDEAAIKKIFEVKGRPSDNPLIAHIANIKDVEQIATKIPEKFFTLVGHFSPGPLTIIIPRKETVPGIVSGGLPTVAVRMPNHPVALELIRAVGEPIVAPSANLSGHPSPTTALHVLDDLNGKIPLILDGGPSTIGIESTVLDLTSEQPSILRPGAITKEQIENVLNEEILVATHHEQSPAKSPGMKYRHYAPNTPITLATTMEEVEKVLNAHSGKQVMILTPISFPIHNANVYIEQLTTPNLYTAFRKADKENIDTILIYVTAEVRKNSALMNRIEKAAA